MKTEHALTCLLLVACGASDAGDPGLVPLDWNADGRFATDLNVPAGSFAEACGMLPVASKVRWSFEAGAPMDFNIHFHEGKVVRFPAKQDNATKASGTLHAKVKQDYCWMWMNKTARDAALKLELKRD